MTCSRCMLNLRHNVNMKWVLLQPFIKPLRLFSTIQKVKHPTLLKTNLNLASKRYLFGITKVKSPEKLRIMDKIPEGYELIYRCLMENYMVMAQVGTFISAAVASIAVLYGWDDIQGLHIDPKDKKPLASNENEFYIFSVAFIILFISVQMFVTKIPLRIYKGKTSKKYKAVFPGGLPFTKNVVEFETKTITKGEESLILPWKKSTYEIKSGVNAIMIDHYFKTPADMNIMLGYQKES